MKYSANHYIFDMAEKYPRNFTKKEKPVPIGDA